MRLERSSEKKIFWGRFVSLQRLGQAMIEGPFLSEVVLHKKINSQDRLTLKECRRQGVAKSVWETRY